MKNTKTPLWILTISVFFGLFVCQYLFEHSSFILNKFSDRTIGIAVLQGIDITARSTYYLKLIFIFNIIFFTSVYILNKIRFNALKSMDPKHISGDENRLFVLSTVSIFTLLFHYINGSPIFVSNLDIFKILLSLNLVIYFSKIFLKRKDALLFQLISNRDIVTLSFLLPLVIIYLRWLIINGSFIFSQKIVPFYLALWFGFWIGLRIINIFVSKKYFSRHILSIIKSSIPLILIPISIPISNEVQYSLSSIYSVTVKQTALINVLILVVISVFLYFLNKKNVNSFNYSKYVFFPILISTVILFNLHTNFLQINYLDIFHNGENLISNQQLFQFGKIPFINIYPTHGISYLLSQVLYSSINGYQTFSPWLWEWIPKIFEILLLYFVLAKLTNSFFSMTMIIFMPIIGIFGGQALVYGYSRSMPTTYYFTAFLAGLVLLRSGSRMNFKSSLMIWTTCLFMTAWRIDFGIASFVSVMIMQLLEIIEPGKKIGRTIKDLKVMIGSLLIVLTTSQIILFILSRIGSASIVEIYQNIFQFVKFQGQAQGLINVATYTPIAMFQYFILPSIGVFYISSYLYSIFIKRDKSIPDYKKLLVYISIFSLVVFVRSFQRHTLSVLGYNPYLFVLLILTLPIFISKSKLKISILLFTAGLFAYQLILPSANVLIKDEQTVKLYEWKNKESRVQVNDYQYREIAKFINSNLEDSQTFVDLSSSPLLYVVTNRKFINYLIPNAYYTSDQIQKNIIKHLSQSYDKKEIPIVIFKQPIPEANSIDGVPNEIRSYMVYEFIYENYMPIGSVDGYVIWIAKDFKLKDREGIIKTDVSKYELNLAKLPYFWGLHDPYQDIYKTNIIKIVVEKPSKLQKGVPSSIFKYDGIDKNAGGVYMSINAISANPGIVDIKLGESSHIKFELVQSEKTINYKIRISSIYQWEEMIKNKFEILSSVDIEITELSIEQEIKI